MEENNLKKTSSSEHLDTDFKELNLKGSQKRSRSGSDQESPSKKLSLSSCESENDNNDQGIVSVRDKLHDLPRAPAFGSLGRRAKLNVNCFRVQCRTQCISQYNIIFDPPLPADSTIRKQSIINKNYEKIHNIFGLFIFDNMRLWSLKKFNEDVDIADSEHSMKIVYIKSVDLKNAPYEEFNQIIHIIFQKATKSSSLVKIGRNYYDKNTLSEPTFLLRRDRIRLFRGYSMNIEQTLNGLQLTVDISHRVISTDSVAGMIDSFEDMLQGKGGRGGGGGRGGYEQDRGRGGYGRGRGSDYDSRQGSGHQSSRDSYGSSSSNDERVRNNSEDLTRMAKEEIIGRCVITTYRMRNWRIDDIDFSQNIDSKFPWRKKNGETVQVTYRDYFMENYRLKLTNTRYGMLVNMPKRNNNKVRRFKGPDRFVLPPEACYMTGLSPKMKADFGLMKRIRDIVSLNPRERFKGIEKMVGQVSKNLEDSSSSDGKSDGSEESNESYLKIDINPQALSFNSRILKDVGVRLKTDSRHQDVLAKDLMRHWGRSGYVNQNPHVIRRWVVFYEGRDRNAAHQLVSELMKHSAQYKMLSKPMDVIEVRAQNRNAVFSKWKDMIEERIEKITGLELIVAVIPSHHKSDDVYSAVKTATLVHEKKLIPSQCIKAQRFEPRNQRSLRSVISSTLKQTLVKRGNIPWIVNYEIRGSFNPFNKATMICGIDVNHDMKRNRSTAAFCVSGDSRFSRYDTYVSLSAANVEHLTGAEKCMVKSILNFNNENGQLPQHIVVYRDGVSNSELVKVLKTEVKSFRDAFKHKEVLKKAKGEYKPKLTFVVVQKRVSLRIFSERLDSGAPGTVVDSDIVSSRFWDFYMLTTKAPPGKTSRPTRYVVVYDDYGITNDDLQSFTNQLCHTYYNFPGPIRVPAPCQISHQVAYLYGSIISEQKERMLFTPKCRGKAYYL